jgi:polyferredoxin
LAKKKPKNQLPWYQRIRTYRLITQGIVFIFIAFILWRHLFYYDRNLEEYCPFGGLETLYSYLTKDTFLRNTSMSNLVLFGLIVLITLLFRGGFCSWICPLGTSQEIIRKTGYYIGRLPGIKIINNKYRGLIRKNRAGLHEFDKQMRTIKYFLLPLILIATWYAGVMVIRDYDIIVATMKITTGQITFALIMLIFFIVMSLFITRPFCKYLCPMGATINIIGLASPLRIVKNDSICTSCRLCERACPMDIDIVAQEGKIDALDCNHCLNCLDACNRDGVLDLEYFPKNLYNLKKKKAFLKSLTEEKEDSNEQV